MSDSTAIPLEHVQSRILLLRGQRVLIDADRSVNAANRSQNATGSPKHRDPRFLPNVFTEHSAIQAANIRNSDAATEMSR